MELLGTQFFFLLFYISNSIADAKVDGSGDVFCGMEYFAAAYVNQTSKVEKTDMLQKARDNCPNKCGGKRGMENWKFQLRYFYIFDKNVQLVAKPWFENFLVDTKCTAVVYTYHYTSRGRTYQDISVYSKEDDLWKKLLLNEIEVDIDFASNVYFKIELIPRIDKTYHYVNSTSYSKCETWSRFLTNNISDTVKLSASSPCRDRDYLKKIGKQKCIQFPESGLETIRRKVIDNFCNNTKSLAVPVPYVAKLTNLDGSSNKSMVVLGTSLSVSIVVVAILFFAFRYKRKCLFWAKKNEGLLLERGKEGKPTVLIINRPGCDILENTIQILVEFLLSYGVEAKLMSEDTISIHESGGIAVYLNENMQKCDVILVMCTEPYQGKDKSKAKNKRYDFALTVIEGQVFHDGKHAKKFFTMYTGPFTDAKRYIPSTLYANEKRILEIPRDLKRLVRRSQDESGTGESKNRRKFMKEISEVLNEYQRSEHVNCDSRTCNKGGKTSKYASTWATTSIAPSCKQYNNEYDMMDDTSMIDDICAEEEGYFIIELPEKGSNEKCESWIS